jgi:hypothetical protein
LASAKRASQKDVRPRKSKTELSQPLKDRFSTLDFSKLTTSDIPSAGSSSSRPFNVHRLNNVHFKNPTTPQILEATVEIKDAEDAVDSEDIPDLEVGDELPILRVSFIPLIYEIYFQVI